MTLFRAALMPATRSPCAPDAEFQRLASVRARLQSRRRWRVAALSGFVIGVAILALNPVRQVMPGRSGASAVERILWSLGAVPPDGARGEIRGMVTATERPTGRIAIGAGMFGLLSVPFAVTADTRIVVGDKQGGFGDILESQDVSVTYEVRRGIPEATRVEIVDARRHLTAQPAYR